MANSWCHLVPLRDRKASPWVSNQKWFDTENLPCGKTLGTKFIKIIIFKLKILKWVSFSLSIPCQLYVGACSDPVHTSSIVGIGRRWHFCSPEAMRKHFGDRGAAKAPPCPKSHFPNVFSHFASEPRWGSTGTERLSVQGVGWSPAAPTAIPSSETPRWEGGGGEKEK